MPDLGISVLLKGKNMIRLLGGLWVALRISLISVVISIPLGILLGIVETMVSAYISTGYRDAISFTILIVVLLFMPNGMFGKKAINKV